MQTSLEIGRLVINQPMTVATNFLITGVAWWLATRLFSRSDIRARRDWGLALVFIGTGALLGGIAHGFFDQMSATLQTVNWKGTVYAVGLGSYFGLSGTLNGAPMSRAWRTGITAYNVIALLVFAVVMLGHDDFLYVILHYLPGLAWIAGISVWAGMRYMTPGALPLLGGVFVSLAAAAIQQSGLTLHAYMNHNDLYHLVQVGALWLFFRGATQLTDQQKKADAAATASAFDLRASQ